MLPKSRTSIHRSCSPNTLKICASRATAGPVGRPPASSSKPIATTGKVLADLLSIDTVQILRDPDPASNAAFNGAPPDGWHEASRSADSVVWVRDQPWLNTGQLVWTSEGTAPVTGLGKQPGGCDPRGPDGRCPGQGRPQPAGMARIRRRRGSRRGAAPRLPSRTGHPGRFGGTKRHRALRTARMAGRRRRHHSRGGVAGTWSVAELVLRRRREGAPRPPGAAPAAGDAPAVAAGKVIT